MEDPYFLNTASIQLPSLNTRLLPTDYQQNDTNENKIIRKGKKREKCSKLNRPHESAGLEFKTFTFTKTKLALTIYGLILMLSVTYIIIIQHNVNRYQINRLNELYRSYGTISERLDKLYDTSLSNNDKNNPIRGAKFHFSPRFQNGYQTESVAAKNSGNLRITNARRQLPTALIIGARKCGTRALLEFLNLHPDIHTARYELHFFDTNETYAKGLDWYRSQMPLSGQNQITLEKTPAYFTSGLAPERVARMNSSVKLILILRDPVVRTISDFTQVHYTKLSKNKTHGSFKTLIFDRKTDRLNTDYKPVRNSLYVKHLRRWLQFFPMKNILIVNGDNFVHFPMDEIRKIERFLGLQLKIRHDQLYFNATKGFYCFKLLRPDYFPDETLFKDNNSEQEAMGLSSPVNVSEETTTTTKCLGDSKGRPHVRVSPATKEQLSQALRPYTERFFALAGIRFDDWE